MSTIEQIDAELARLQAEIARVERAPRSFDEVWAATIEQLDLAEATFRRLGPGLGGVVSQLPEYVAERHRAMVGLALVANRKAVIDSERSRVRAATEGGISAADKVRRLDELRRQIMKAAAKRELAVRGIEGDGFMPRPLHAH